MTVQILSVNTAADSFGQWIAKTNQIAAALSTVAVSTNSNTASGNASIDGTFSANGLAVSNTGYFSIGSDVSNTVAAATYYVLQTSPTTNNVITSTGMVIDGVTSYTKNFMSIGTTTVSGMDISTNAIHIATALTLGDSVLTNTSIKTDTSNTVTQFVANASIIGDVEANVQINRDGISIFANPTGMLVVNSYMNSTDLYIQNIHANSVILNDPTRTSTFLGNTIFEGANNYFQNGLNAGGSSLFNNITVSGNSAFNGTNNYFTNGLTSAGPISVANDINVQHVNAYQQVVANGIRTKDYVTFLGATSGSTTLKAAAIAGSTTFTLPTADGTSTQVLATDGRGNLYWHTSIGDTSTDFSARSIGIGEAASGNPGNLNMTGYASIGVDLTVGRNINAVGNITAYYSSDKRIKTNIKNIENPLDKLLKLNGVEFDWTDDFMASIGGEDGVFVRKHNIGVIAQEVEEVLPELVNNRPDSYKGVQYDKLVALLIEAIKELKAEVDSLKNGNSN
jgi:Chaperone of endosialidase